MKSFDEIYLAKEKEGLNEYLSAWLVYISHLKAKEQIVALRWIHDERPSTFIIWKQICKYRF